MALLPVNKPFDEPGHFTLLNYSIVIDIELREEHIELLHTWWSHVLRRKNLIEEVGCLYLIEHARSVRVILVPNSLNHVTNEFLLAFCLSVVNWRQLARCEIEIF